MMRRTWLQRLPLLAAALAPLLHPTATRARGSAQVWLRVRNSSQEAFTHVWQGLPQQGTDVDLGPLLPGDTSRWHVLPATLAHYRKTRIQIGQRQLTHVTEDSDTTTALCNRQAGNHGEGCAHRRGAGIVGFIDQRKMAVAECDCFAISTALKRFGST